MHTQAVEHNMATFPELSLAVCSQRWLSAEANTTSISTNERQVVNSSSDGG